MLARAVDLLEVWLDLWGSQIVGLFLEHFAVADDGIERGPQFVGHVGQKLRLGLAGRLCCHLCYLESLALRFDLLQLLQRHAIAGFKAQSQLTETISKRQKPLSAKEMTAGTWTHSQARSGFSPGWTGSQLTISFCSFRIQLKKSPPIAALAQ